VAGLDLTPYEEGVIVGVLLGEGHFGGDGRQPQVTVRMHVRHEALVRWLHDRIPRSRLYGPYHHGDRHYFQWMVRGAALTEDLYPVLERRIGPELDAHAYERITTMREKYPAAFTPPRSGPRAARAHPNPGGSRPRAGRDALPPHSSPDAPPPQAGQDLPPPRSGSGAPPLRSNPAA
jgi:hypothetical protein